VCMCVGTRQCKHASSLTGVCCAQSGPAGQHPCPNGSQRVYLEAPTGLRAEGEQGWPRPHVIFILILRVGQNHMYTVNIRYFWQGNRYSYGHTRCVYTVLANPIRTP